MTLGLILNNGVWVEIIKQDCFINDQPSLLLMYLMFLLFVGCLVVVVVLGWSYLAALSAYSWICTKEWLLVVLRRPFGVPGIKLGSGRQVPHPLYYHSGPNLTGCFYKNEWVEMPAIPWTSRMFCETSLHSKGWMWTAMDRPQFLPETIRTQAFSWS